MSQQTYDARPAMVNWMFIEGDTVRLALTFYTDIECTTPLDITGMTFTAKLSDRKGLTVDGTTAISGHSTVTVRFHDGANEIKIGLYHYAILATTVATGERQTLVAGEIEISSLESGCGCGY